MDSDLEDVCFARSHIGEYERCIVRPCNKFHGSIFELIKRVLRDRITQRDAPHGGSDSKFKKNNKNCCRQIWQEPLVDENTCRKYGVLQ